MAAQNGEHQFMQLPHTGERTTGRVKPWMVLVAALVILGVVGLFAAGMILAAQPGKRPMAGSPAPDFEMPLYADYRADLPARLKLSDLRGKVVVLNFWASWCVECVKETDDLESVWRQYRDRGAVVLGVDYLDTEAAALKYLQGFGATFPSGVDLKENVSRAYRITGVPETFFIDRRGIVRQVVTQALTRQELARQIEALLAE